MTSTLRIALLAAAGLAALPTVAQSATPPLPPQPVVAAAPGPDLRMKITDEYAALVARDAYFWAWPMVNIYSRRLAAAQLAKMVRSGPTVSAPINRLGMITDYIDPAQRLIACPDQDVVQGLGVLALDISPVVIQVPDFGDRFWVYQGLDLRTDNFVQLGRMYDTKPGFYLLVGPNWKGATPNGIAKVFRASTNTGIVVPRIFQDDTADDKRAIQTPLRQVVMYPLSDYDGSMKSIDWAKIPSGPAPTSAKAGGDSTEMKWVVPEKFVDVLGAVLADAPPLPGEEARYAQVRAVLEAAKADPRRKEAMTDGAKAAEAVVVTPLFQFRAWGQQLPYHWSTVSNEAAFGTDYFTRTAVARSNILPSAPNETKYFYQDLDAAGARLNGRNRYTVTFPKGLVPPVNGFWSLTLYDQRHFLAPNAVGRYSFGTKTKDLKYNPDGSLTIYLQADPPGDALWANWLPAPKDAGEATGDFSLLIRAYGAKPAVIEGAWTPPPVEVVN